MEKERTATREGKQQQRATGRPHFISTEKSTGEQLRRLRIRDERVPLFRKKTQKTNPTNSTTKQRRRGRKGGMKVRCPSIIGKL